MPPGLPAGSRLTCSAHRRAPRRPALSSADSVRVTEPLEFLIFEDNGGAYHFRIVDGDGANLAQSGGFASYDSAEQASRRVRDGAASARFDRRGGRLNPVDLAARRDRPNDD